MIASELALGPRQCDARMHLALTRATIQCPVVAELDVIVADERLRGLTDSTPA